MAMQVDKFSSIDSLPCHFTWNPEHDSTKLHRLDDVIKKTEQKIQREPYMKIAFLTTLAYLHCCKMPVNISEAERYLEEAEELNEQIQEGNHGNQHLECEFIVLADRLHLKNLRNQLSDAEKDEKLQRLNELWRDSSSRARLLGVKGATFDCFGPKKYQIGADAFAEATRLEPDNFHWLYGEARLLGRIARDSYEKSTSERALMLWREARNIGEEKELTNALFYSHYAENIRFADGLRKLSEELCDKSVSMMAKLSPQEKEVFRLVYIIGIKVYRLLELSRKAGELLDQAKQVDSVCRDPEFYVELAKATSDKNEKIDFLTAGKKLDPWHIWINLSLIELEADKKDPRKVLEEYDSLKLDLGSYHCNRAVVNFHKALYLLRKKKVKKAVDTCVQAFTEDASLSGRIPFRMKLEFFYLLCRNKHKNEEYFAWFTDAAGIQEIIKENDSINVKRIFKENCQYCLEELRKFNAEELYRTALERDSKSSFAREQLGRFCLRNEKFTEAAECFRALPQSHKDQKILLAAALMEPDCSAETLVECLQLGRSGAAEKLFDILDAASKGTDAAQSGQLLRSLGKRYSPDPLTEQEAMHWFRRKAYEMCARIGNLIESGVLTESPGNTEKWRKEVGGRIEKVLRLEEKDCGYDRHMISVRRSRLEATKCHFCESDVRKEANPICSVLKESKSSLDKSVKGLSLNISYYPFSFRFIDMKNLQKSGEAMRLSNSEAVIALVNDELRKPEASGKFRDEIKSLLHVQDESQEERNLVTFLTERDWHIAKNENNWTVYFADAVNDMKHSALNKTESDICDLLDKMLAKNTEGPKSAYELMHFAAEFAEETALAILSFNRRESSMTVCGIQLDKDDMDSLQQDCLITDNVISAFVIMLLQKINASLQVHESAGQWHYVNPVTNEQLDSMDQNPVFPAASTAEFYLVPTTLNGNHRILVTVNSRDRVVQILDPAPHPDPISNSAAERLRELARKRFDADFKLEVRECAKQLSPHDSGLMVALFCQELLCPSKDGSGTKFHKGRVKGGRRSIKKLLVNWTKKREATGAGTGSS